MSHLSVSAFHLRSANVTKKDRINTFFYTSLVFTEGSACRVSKETSATINRFLATHASVFAGLDLNSLGHGYILV